MAGRALADVEAVKDVSMYHRKNTLSVFLLFLAGAACAIPGINPSDSNAFGTSAAQTADAGAIPSMPPAIPFTPTMTFTPTLIYPRGTPTLTETATPIPTFTATAPTATPGTASTGTETAVLAPVRISVTVSTNCRSGPGKPFEIVGTLIRNRWAEVHGRTPNSEYWFIKNPGAGAEYCWVWGRYAVFEGDALGVPVVTPQPTLTPLPTPQPVLDFSVRGRGAEKCNADWWVMLLLTNESEYPFKSVRVQMEDVDRGVTKSMSGDGFVNRDGCKYVWHEDVETGKTVVFSGPMFDYNPRGHLLRTYVTVCTEKDQKGVCTTRKIAVTP
jgi:hypothetical protein